MALGFSHMTVLSWTDEPSNIPILDNLCLFKIKDKNRPFFGRSAYTLLLRRLSQPV